MKIVSSTALPHASMIWTNAAQGTVLTVVCKATFALTAGTSPLAEAQEEIVQADEHWNDDVNRSLRLPSDMAPFKARADVLLVGSACAPAHAPTHSVQARLIVGDVDKTIEVTQDRWFQGDGSLVVGQKLTRMPLVYERAGGGPDTLNPVGVRPGAADGLGRVRVPNLTWPGAAPRGAGDFVEPVGFGPLAPSWPARRETLGALAQGGLPDRWQEAPMPEGFDFRYFNAAPQDQQTDPLQAGLRIILENLHPAAPRFVTNLTGLQAFVQIEGRGGAPLPMRADTLWIDTDRLLCTVTYRAQIPLRRPDEPGEIKLWTEPATPKVEAPAPVPARPTPVPASPRTPASGTPLGATLGSPLGAMRPPLSSARPVRQATQEIHYNPADPMPWSQAPTHALPFGSMPVPGAVNVPVPPAANVPVPPAANAPVPAAPPTFFGFHTPPPPPPTPPSTPPPSGLSTTAATPAVVMPPPAALPWMPPAAAWEPPPPAPWSAPVQEPASSIVIPLGATESAVATPVRAEPATHVTPPSPAVALAPAPRRPPSEYVEILWFDDRAPQRIRRVAAWAPLLRGDRKTSEWIVGEEPEEQSREALDRREVRRALGRVPALDAAGIGRAMEDSIDEDGIFDQPVVVVAGDLAMSFDPIETLKTTLAVASQLASGDKRLKEAIDAAGDLSNGPRGALGPLVEGALTRVRQAFALANRSLAPDYLETAVQRLLTEERNYSKRRLFGGTHIGGLLTLGGGGAPLPAYMPEALAEKLPLFPKFRVRAVAEPHAQQDPADSEPVALRLLALGRAVQVGAPPKRER